MCLLLYARCYESCNFLSLGHRYLLLLSQDMQWTVLAQRHLDELQIPNAVRVAQNSSANRPSMACRISIFCNLNNILIFEAIAETYKHLGNILEDKDLFQERGYFLYYLKLFYLLPGCGVLKLFRARPSLI